VFKYATTAIKQQKIPALCTVTNMFSELEPGNTLARLCLRYWWNYMPHFSSCPSWKRHLGTMHWVALQLPLECQQF